MKAEKKKNRISLLILLDWVVMLCCLWKDACSLVSLITSTRTISSHQFLSRKSSSRKECISQALCDRIEVFRSNSSTKQQHWMSGKEHLSLVKDLLFFFKHSKTKQHLRSMSSPPSPLLILLYLPFDWEKRKGSEKKKNFLVCCCERILRVHGRSWSLRSEYGLLWFFASLIQMVCAFVVLGVECMHRQFMGDSKLLLSNSSKNIPFGSCSFTHWSFLYSQADWQTSLYSLLSLLAGRTALDCGSWSCDVRGRVWWSYHNTMQCWVWKSIYPMLSTFPHNRSAHSLNLHITTRSHSDEPSTPLHKDKKHKIEQQQQQKQHWPHLFDWSLSSFSSLQSQTSSIMHALHWFHLFAHTTPSLHMNLVLCLCDFLIFWLYDVNLLSQGEEGIKPSHLSKVVTIRLGIPKI